MVTLILILFFLTTTSQPTQVCALWLSHPATSNDFAKACPPLSSLASYEVLFRDWRTWMVECTAPAGAIYSPSRYCSLTKPLDSYRMEITQQPKVETLLCAVKSMNDPPTHDEILAQCGAEIARGVETGSVKIQKIGPVMPEPSAPVCTIPSPAFGPGLYDQPAISSELGSSTPLSWLAGRLIWTGIIVPSCPNRTSGLDPVSLDANGCGMDAARLIVDSWQNSFDNDIFTAAEAEGIPARLFKRLLMKESQFWPMWGEGDAGEVGMAQVTKNAADVYLRIYGPDDYAMLSPIVQIQEQEAFLDDLRCPECDLGQAIQKEHANIPVYAKILKAYRCNAADWRGAVVNWDGETYAEQIEAGN